MLNRKLVMNLGIEKVAVMLLTGTLAASIFISLNPQPPLGRQLQAAPQGTTPQILLPDERISITPSSGESMRSP